MERRHEDVLNGRFEQVADEGRAHIKFTELRRWYGVERIAARTKRDLMARWTEVIGDGRRKLQFIQDDSGFLFIDPGKVQNWSVDSD